MVGFTNMTWTPPAITEAAAGHYITDAGLVEVKPDGSMRVAREVKEEDFDLYPVLVLGERQINALAEKRRGFPWWLLIVAGYVTYREYAG